MRRHRVRIRPDQLREAEVGDLHAAVAIEQHVLRLDVAVHDAAVVRELQRVADLRDDAQRLRGRQPSRALHLPQVHAVDELHQQVVQAARLAEVVDGDDVRVLKAREGARLAREALGEARVARDGGRQNLERDQSVEPRLPRLVDGAHAALADQFEDLELRKERAQVVYCRRRESSPGRWTPGPCPCGIPT